MTQNYYKLGKYKVQEAGAANGAMPAIQNGQLEYIPGRATATTPDGWDDLVSTATAINPAGISGPATYNPTECAWVFPDAATRRLDFVFQMPHRWKEGSTVKFHIHAFHSAPAGGNTRWQMLIRTWDIGAAKGAFSTSYITIAAPGSTAHTVLDLATIDMTGLHISAIVQIQLSRLGADGADTYMGTVSLMSADLHYQSDTMTGSSAESSK